MPLLGWAIMWSIGGYSLVQDWNPANGYTSWEVPGATGASAGRSSWLPARWCSGSILMFIYRAFAPPFFRGEVLNAGTATLVPEDLGTPIGLFGIEPDGAQTDKTG